MWAWGLGFGVGFTLKKLHDKQKQCLLKPKILNSTHQTQNPKLYTPSFGLMRSTRRRLFDLGRIDEVSDEEQEEWFQRRVMADPAIAAAPAPAYVDDALGGGAKGAGKDKGPAKTKAPSAPAAGSSGGGASGAQRGGSEGVSGS